MDASAYCTTDGPAWTNPLETLWCLQLIVRIASYHRLKMATPINRGMWSEDEHGRFLEAIHIYPQGPWRLVAQYVVTRDVRQVQTHAQKYNEKVTRHLRGLRKERRSTARAEHRIDNIPGRSHEQHKIKVVEFDYEEIEAIESWFGLVDDARASQESAVELPSLEESLDILLEYLSDH